MAGLLSTSQLTALRSVVRSGMVTPVTILKRTVADSPFSDDDAESFPEGETVDGWLRDVPTGTIDVVSGIMATPGTYRLFLPLGTDVTNGDRVRVGDNIYVVQDTNDESTYKVTLRLTLNRAE